MQQKYITHLFNSEIKGTKEYQINKLIGVLALISKFEDKINSIKEMCRYVYGVNEDGKILGDKKQQKKLKDAIYAKKRLKIYYNNKITQLTKFSTT